MSTKTAALPLPPSTAARAVAPSRASTRLAAYVELTKPRITTLIVLTSAAGFALGSRAGVNYLLLAHTLIGIGLLSSGIGTLNQYLERDLDGLMRRTAERPLPSGRLFPFEALWFGVSLTLMAEVYLALFVNVLTALLGLTVITGYLFVYTPLKTRTSLSTALGAFPGAMPPLMGWTAARGEIDTAAWVLFAIVFLWQFPHFLSIAWMYREDYGRAGIRMLPVVEPDGRLAGNIRKGLPGGRRVAQSLVPCQQCARRFIQIKQRCAAPALSFGALLTTVVWRDGSESMSPMGRMLFEGD